MCRTKTKRHWLVWLRIRVYIERTTVSLYTGSYPSESRVQMLRRMEMLRKLRLLRHGVASRSARRVGGWLRQAAVSL